MPIPRGISELDVAGLTPLPSRKVQPTGVKECPINLEAKVISSQNLTRQVDALCLPDRGSHC